MASWAAPIPVLDAWAVAALPVAGTFVHFAPAQEHPPRQRACSCPPSRSAATAACHEEDLLSSPSHPNPPAVDIPSNPPAIGVVVGPWQAAPPKDWGPPKDLANSLSSSTRADSDDEPEPESTPEAKFCQAFQGSASRGSRNHFRGQCKPCRDVWTEGGCARGEECNFCHFTHDAPPAAGAPEGNASPVSGRAPGQKQRHGGRHYQRGRDQRAVAEFRQQQLLAGFWPRRWGEPPAAATEHEPASEHDTRSCRAGPCP